MRENEIKVQDLYEGAYLLCRGFELKDLTVIGSNGKTIVTFCCDLAERSYSKLYNPEFLKEKKITVDHETLASMFDRYQAESASVVITVR